MSYIEEPKNVDLVIAGGSLTAEDRRLIRATIQRQKSANKARATKPHASNPARAKRARRTVGSKVKTSK